MSFRGLFDRKEIPWGGGRAVYGNQSIQANVCYLLDHLKKKAIYFYKELLGKYVTSSHLLLTMEL